MENKEPRKQKYNPEKIVESVKAWQSSPYVKHLTCRQCETDLAPKKEGNKITLFCPKCAWVQQYVPKPVIQYKIERPSVLKRNQDNYNHTLVFNDVPETKKD